MTTANNTCTSRRVETIIMGFARRGSYTLPNGSIVVMHERMSTGPGKPMMHVFTLDDGSQIRALDGTSIRF